MLRSRFGCAVCHGRAPDLSDVPAPLNTRVSRASVLTCTELDVPVVVCSVTGDIELLPSFSNCEKRDKKRDSIVRERAKHLLSQVFDNHTMCFARTMT